MMRHKILTALALLGLLASPALANFINANFEAIPSSGWSQYSAAFYPEGVICSVAACGDAGGLAGPNSDSQWAFFGGNYADSYGNESAYLEQTAFFLNEPGSLLFYLWIGSNGDGNSQDYLRVSVDGNVLVTFTGLDPATTGYVPVTLDVTAYSDGLQHNLRFEFAAAASANPVVMSLDDVSLVPNSVPEPASAQLLCAGLLAALGGAGVRRLRRR
jgi:hypothetical protein